MKKKSYAAFAVALVLAIAMAGCEAVRDEQTADSSEFNSVDVAESVESTDSSVEESLPSQSEDSEPSQSESKKKPAHAAIGDNGAKAVTDVLLFPYEDMDISRDVQFFDMYGIHVLHSGVVGLVGAPVDVQFDPDKVEGGKLVFVYDPDELKGVRPDALMFMWYDEENGNYQELPDGILNTDNCSMNLRIDKPGVYLLVNMYEWLNAWGAGLEDNGLEDGYDPSQQPISSELWEKHERAGDIPELADENYIRSCHQSDGSYVFEVSDPVQLASAVYFVNCANENGKYDVIIDVMNDINLDGYDWAPMGWYTAGVEYDFMGEVVGNGHTIKNMNIDSTNYAGFIGMGTDCTVSDLKFENAYVSGRNPGIVIGYARNSFVSGCSAEGETDGIAAGTVVGIDQSSVLTNCTAEVVANGEYVSDFLSGNDMAASQVSQRHEITETIWLDDNDRPCREEGLENKYDNLGWRIKRYGVQVLDRNAEKETVLQWQDIGVISVPGHYEVTLTAFVEGYYIPISNTVEYDVEWQE
ncbi:MAG: hypothetical protein J1E39_08955 [Eubacterium sp.]|nr:hypothetical protein [Eubacterium sp.]